MGWDGMVIVGERDDELQPHQGLEIILDHATDGDISERNHSHSYNKHIVLYFI